MLDFRALLLLSAISGMGGLVYEVLYLRLLSTVLGDMLYVHILLLGTFLLGNGIGALLARRYRNQLHVVELVIGSYAIALPGLIVLYQSSWVNALQFSPAVHTFLSALILLVVPAVAIGSSIPLFSLYIQRFRPDYDGFKITYLLYHLGSAFSILLVEFFVIRVWGIQASLLVLGAANITCGLMIFLMQRSMLDVASSSRRESGSYLPLVNKYRDLLALILASFAAAIFQGMFLKLTYTLFRPQRENFAICTAVALLLIAVGTAMVRRWRISFSTCVLSAAVLLPALYLCYPAFSAYYEDLSHSTVGPMAGIAVKMCFATLIGLPYLFLGATIPALMNDEEQVVERSGELLFVSGFANLLGLISFTFIFHPFTSYFAIGLPVVFFLIVAAGVQDGSYFSPRTSKKSICAGAAVVLAVVLAGYPDKLAYLPAGMLGKNIKELTHFKSGSDSASLFVESNGMQSITYNGHPSILVSRNGAPNWAEVVSGVIPALYAPGRERVMVLGLGSGITAGAASSMFKSTDVIEINGAFLPMADQLEDVNFSVTKRDGANVVHEDARRFLSESSHLYDAIINSVPSPEVYSAGKIYTLEFFQMIRRRLKPNGVFGSWFSPLETSPRGIPVFLNTLSQVFPQCALSVLASGYYFVTCSADEQPLVRTPLPRHDRDLPWMFVFRQMQIHADIDAYFSAISLSENIFGGTRDFGATGTNTDDLPILEFIISEAQAQRAEINDPVTENPGDFNLPRFGSEDSYTLIHRAVVFASIYNRLFKRYYLPVLEEDRKLRRAVLLELGKIKVLSQ